MPFEREEQYGTTNEYTGQRYESPADLKKAVSPDAVQFTEWVREPTLPELLEDVEYARQENEEQKANVKGWLDLRNVTGSEEPKPSKTKKSTVQPKMIRKHNEWRYPALSEPYLDTDRMFKVRAETPDDVKAARQNEVLLNWQFETKINKVDFIGRYVQTCVDEGTVVVRVGWETEYTTKEVEVPVYTYDYVEDPDEAGYIIQAAQMFEAEDPEYTLLDDELKAAAEKTVELNTPVRAVHDGYVTEVQEVMSKNCPSLTVVDGANLFVDSACLGDPDKASFKVYTHEATQSNLRAQKDRYSNLDAVNWEENRVTSQLTNQDHETTTPANDVRSSGDKAPVLVYEYWGLYDTQDTGVMVPIVVSWIGDTIIEMRQNPFPDQKPPYVIVPYMLLLRSVFGEADASMLEDNQRISGALMRAMINLLGKAANAQTGYAEGLLDPVNERKLINGEDFKYQPSADINGGIQQLKFPELPGSGFDMLTLQNQEAESLTGVKAFYSGVSGDTLGRLATGVRGALDSASRREMSILRRLSKGMTDIGRKIMAMNAMWLSEEETIRITDDEFVTIRKEDLKGSFNLRVDVSTAEVDEQRAQELAFMLQTIGPHEDPEIRKMILMEIAYLRRMPAMAEKLENYTPEPDPLTIAREQAEIAKLEAEAALDNARAMKAQMESLQIQQEMENIASGVTHKRDIHKMGAQARGNRDLEVTKGLVKGEAPTGNIEAAMGFNELTKAKNDSETGPASLFNNF